MQGLVVTHHASQVPKYWQVSHKTLDILRQYKFYTKVKYKLLKEKFKEHFE